MRIPLQVQSAFGIIRGFLTLRYAILVGVCFWVMYVQIIYRVPGRFLFLLLPWISLALGALNLVLLLRYLMAENSTGPLQETLQKIERGVMVIIAVFFLYGLIIYLNGRLDESGQKILATEILAINGDETDLGFAIPYTWAELRSWKNPNQIERVFLRWKEQDELWGGEAVQVRLRRGYFNIPWVLTIDKDQEKASREILKINPTASHAWVDLVNFYIQSRRWKEASETAHEYLKVYPKNYDFAHNVGTRLIANNQNEAGVGFLEYVIERRPSYQDMQLLGWTLHVLGKNDRAEEVLKSSMALDSDDWQVYYNLGGMYFDMGKYEESLEMFEIAVKREPNFPELQQRIDIIHKRIADRKAKSSS